MCQSRRFRGDSFEYVVHKAIHDAHSLAGNSRVRMYLLQYFVDVNGVTLLPLPLLLLVGLANILLGLAGLLHGFATRFRRHFSYSRKAIADETTIQRPRCAEEKRSLP